MSKDKSGNWFKRHKILTGVLAFILLMIIIGATGGDSKDVAKKNAAPTSSSSNTATTQPAVKEAEKKPDVPTEYKSALNKAGSYSKTMHMSKQGIYDQLTSEYGEKFSAAAAQYAIDNVQADWNANALAKAKSYQEQQSMSPAAIRTQLSSSYGEKFTAAEADYAVQHLSD